MKAAAFLWRGLAWGAGGLALLTATRPSGAAAAFAALAWLAGLAVIGAMTRSGEKKNAYGMGFVWAFMVLAFGFILIGTKILQR